MAGYTKIFTKSGGDRIDAEDFNDEFDLVDDAFLNSTGHKHDGAVGEGGLVPIISDATGFTTVQVDGILNKIELSVNVASAKELQLTLADGLLVPASTNDVDLGTPTLKFNDIHSVGTYTGSLTLAAGGAVAAILDEDTMSSNDDEALATQQSIKAFVESTVGAAPGIFSQTLITRRQSDQALSGAMADYLMLSITVEENSKVIIFASVTGMASNYPGTVFADLYIDNVKVTATTEETVLASANTLAASEEAPGSATLIDCTAPLTAGSYTIAIKLREQGTDGVATQATLLLMEQAA